MRRKSGRAAKPFLWRLEYLVNLLVENLVGCLPGKWAFRLGEILGGLAWYLLPVRRQTVLRNLRIAYAGEKTREEIEALARASFRRTGANLISVAHTARLPVARLGEVFHLKNPELMAQTLAHGRGVVLLLAHMGNWELLSRIGHFFPAGTPTGALYRPLNNPLLEPRVLKRRQADGTRMFSKGGNPLHVAGFLRDGGVVGILADQRVGKKGELVRFFGRLTRASPLPDLLARRAKSPMLALSLRTIAPGKWQGEFIPVDQPSNARHCMLALERAMSAAPEDVFWLQDRWKVYAGPRQSFAEWLGEGRSDETKRHRVLLWLLGDIAGCCDIPPNWLHPDADYEVVLPEGASPPPWLQPDVRIHAMPRFVRRSDVMRFLAKIDADQALPLDFILAVTPPASLCQAAKRLAIPVFQLS